jgi:N-acetylmuramoyl-L-alanine amidase
MRLLCVLMCLLIAGAVTTMARPASQRLEQISLYGYEYVRLNDWARENDFDVRAAKRDDPIVVSNERSRLVFNVDSRRAQINGINVSLSVPVAERGGTIYLGAIDVQTVVQPVLNPQKRSKSSRPMTVCIDAGHGGKDPGNLDGRYQEKRQTLLLAEQLRDLLKRAGFKVIMTRSSDRFIELPVRPEIANRNRADLFVSLHFNSAQAASAQGAEVYCMTPARASSTNAQGEGAGTRAFPGNACDRDNMLLSYLIQKSIVKKLSVEDRGVHRARFNVLREARMPAVLIEGGFMSHPQESRRIYDGDYRRQLAQAIVDGILSYKHTINGTALANR